MSIPVVPDGQHRPHNTKRAITLTARILAKRAEFDAVRGRLRAVVLPIYRRVNRGERLKPKHAGYLDSFGSDKKRIVEAFRAADNVEAAIDFLIDLAAEREVLSERVVGPPLPKIADAFLDLVPPPDP